MDHPDEAARVSRSPSGEVSEKPDKVVAVVVTDSDDDPCGLLEKWNGDTWIYASADDLIEIN